MSDIEGVRTTGASTASGTTTEVTHKETVMPANQHGVIQMILAGMHPSVKAIVFSVLAIPLVLAISGMLLQLNIGALINEYIKKIEVSDATLEGKLDEKLGALDQRLAAMEQQIGVGNDASATAIVELSKVLTDTRRRVDELEKRAEAADQAVDKLRKWACKHAGQELPCNL